MIDFVMNFWAIITAPLSWLPPFAQVFLVVVGALFCVVLIVSIIAGIAKAIAAIWELLPTN